MTQNNENYIDFTAKILKNERFDASYIEFPFSAEAIFGKKGQVKVKVWFDNAVFYRGSLVKMDGKHLIIITKPIRERLGKTFGDEVIIKLCQDTEERIIKVPDEVENLLKINNVWDIFSEKSYTFRKEHISSILQAKKEETKHKRIQKLMEALVKP